MENVFKALCKFQEEIKTISFDSTVKVIMKSGSSYNFKYATFTQIVEVAKPILAKQGLSVWQGFKNENGKQFLTTLICHESGEAMPESVIELRCTGNSQERGAEITYMRRYAYSSALGLVSDEDTDGNHSDDKDFKKESLKPESQKNEVAKTPIKINTPKIKIKDTEEFDVSFSNKDFNQEPPF